MVASGFVYAGRQLPVPLKVTRPGATTAGFMIATWLLAIYIVLVATFVYGLQVKAAYPSVVAARVRVGTFVDALVTFVAILYSTSCWDWKVALASAVIGTAAAPMIFELTFDSGHRDADKFADPDPSDALSATLLPAVVPGRVIKDIAADVATFDARDRVRMLGGGRNVYGICRLDCVGVRLSRRTAAARVEHHFEGPVFRSGDHAVCRGVFKSIGQFSCRSTL